MLKSKKCKALHVTKPKCSLVHQYVINENNLSAVDKHISTWAFGLNLL